ncbi:MAG TPA: carboxypeptidase-like regulatory domain-containing protein [Pyrinomonadaceae bacterium]|nr:carboxypeptidase-like regulatory domain-containing protein [Pyrinomonadaceae bacterium]
MTTANPNGRVFWVGLLLLLAAFTVTAQEFRGSLAGKITDPNGAVVPGSKVEIKNIETGVASAAVTGEDGSYNFALLPPGTSPAWPREHRTTFSLTSCVTRTIARGSRASIIVSAQTGRFSASTTTASTRKIGRIGPAR